MNLFDISSCISYGQSRECPEKPFCKAASNRGIHPQGAILGSAFTKIPAATSPREFHGRVLNSRFPVNPIPFCYDLLESQLSGRILVRFRASARASISAVCRFQRGFVFPRPHPPQLCSLWDVRLPVRFPAPGARSSTSASSSSFSGVPSEIRQSVKPSSANQGQLLLFAPSASSSSSEKITIKQQLILP